MNFKNLIELVKETFREWSEDKVPRLAAALAYYTVFSLAPLLILVIAIAGFIIGNNAEVRQQLMTQVQGLMGAQGAEAIGTMIDNAATPSSGILATIIGVVTLLFGATGVFGQLQDALNTIWDVPPKKSGGFMGMIKDRFLSFTMILGIAFLLLVSLIISAALSALSGYLNSLFGGAEFLAQVLNFIVSTAVTTLIFALIFKILPDVDVEWKDVWLGALVTAVLFNLGKTLIGLYLGNSSTTSVYGAAGSLVVILLWVYYSAQILFLGAEFTQVYARRYGSKVVEEQEKQKKEKQPGTAGQPKSEPIQSPTTAGQVMIPVAGQPSIYRRAERVRVRYEPSQPGKVVPVIALGAAAGVYTLQRIARRLRPAPKPTSRLGELREKVQEKIQLGELRERVEDQLPKIKEQLPLRKYRKRA